MTGEELYVWVRRQWNAVYQAKYRLCDLSGVRWDTISGGAMTTAPQPFIHGYVWCNAMLEGELNYSCVHGDGPQHIKVCVVQRDNTPAIVALLKAQAGPRPMSQRHKRASKGGA